LFYLVKIRTSGIDGSVSTIDEELASAAKHNVGWMGRFALNRHDHLS